jgi:hypothetical protein
MISSYCNKGKEYYIQRPATRAEEDGSTMKNPYLANYESGMELERSQVHRLPNLCDQLAHLGNAMDYISLTHTTYGRDITCSLLHKAYGHRPVTMVMVTCM